MRGRRVWVNGDLIEKIESIAIANGSTDAKALEMIIVQWLESIGVKEKWKLPESLVKSEKLKKVETPVKAHVDETPTQINEPLMLLDGLDDDEFEPIF